MKTETSKTNRSPAAQKMLRVAERLIAEKGIDGVSSRELAREAGQKNHSAVNYHFGSFDGLVNAIIDERAGNINAQRESLLAAIDVHGGAASPRALLDAMIRPLAEELLRDDGNSRYLNLLGQLLSRPRWQRLFFENRARSQALLRISALLSAQLPTDMPEAIRHSRQALMGRHIIHSVAYWDELQHSGSVKMNEQELEWRIQDLINYSLAGLMAPHRTESA